jgi:4-amino-4-deoxy-L-arabinose transferase-like glycosyltransferase
MTPPTLSKDRLTTRFDETRRPELVVEAAKRIDKFGSILWLSVAYLCIRMPWVLAVPRTEAPDEANHLWVATFLREHLRLPAASEVFAAGTPAEYGSLPQLGYIPHVAYGLFFPLESFETAARFGTLLIGLPTIWIAYLFAREVFPTNKLLSTALPLLVVLHPQLVFTQSYTNTDATTVTLTSLCLYLVVVSIKRGFKLSRGIIVGLAMGMAALCKHTSLALLIPVLGGLAVSCYLSGMTLFETAVAMAIVVTTFLATCTWWFIRNYNEFNGDWLGSRTMYQTWSQILPRQNGQIVNPWPPITSHAWWRYVFFDFWGLFGYMNRYLWRPLYLALLGLCACSVFGWLKAVWSKTRSRRDSDEPEETDNQARQTSTLWLFLTACGLFNMAAVVYATISGVTGPHGRYLFPSELALMALLLAGLSRVGGKFEKFAVITVVLLCGISTFWGWFVYYGKAG